MRDIIAFKKSHGGVLATTDQSAKIDTRSEIDFCYHNDLRKKERISGVNLLGKLANLQRQWRCKSAHLLLKNFGKLRKKLKCQAFWELKKS